MNRCTVCRYIARRGGNSFQESLQRGRLDGLSYREIRLELGVPAKLSRSALYRHLTQHHRDVPIAYNARAEWERHQRHGLLSC
jgi:hypothetical protein